MVASIIQVIAKHTFRIQAIGAAKVLCNTYVEMLLTL